MGMDRKDRRRYPRDFWEDIFSEISEEFMSMRKQMDRFVKDSFRAFDESGKQTKPMVYGFTFRMGPDGVPHFEQFGDTRFRKFRTGDTGNLGKREPMTDMIEGEDNITITMELPGIEKSDINLEAVEEELVIDVDTEARKYHKKLKLPDNLDLETIEANYKNGVLDIKIQRKAEIAKMGKKIEIK